MPIAAEFYVGDGLNFSLRTDGTKDYHTFAASASYPLNFVNGYIGGELRQLHEINAQSAYFVRSRIEGGYHKNRLGLRGYARFDKDTLHSLESLWHGGAYLHVDIIDSENFEINGGVGTWLSQEELSSDIDVDTSLEYGPQAHVELRISKFSIFCEYLPEHDFGDYEIRLLPVWSIPIGRFLFMDKIYFEVSGVINYRTDIEFLERQHWHWNWKHALRIEF